MSIASPCVKQHQKKHEDLARATELSEQNGSRQRASLSVPLVLVSFRPSVLYALLRILAAILVSRFVAIFISNYSRFHTAAPTDIVDASTES